MFDSTLNAVWALEEAVRGLEPEGLSGVEARAALGDVIRGERLCAAAKVALAAWIDKSGAYQGTGARSGADLLAKEAGTSKAAARRSLDNAAALEKLPATKEAFAKGEISEPQAEAVARAASDNAEAEADLLETAKTQDLVALRDKARKVREAAEDRDARHQRQHSAREFTHFIDDEGMVNGRFRLPPEVGTPISNRIEAETDRVFRQSYKEGKREDRKAYAADALVKLLSGEGKGHATRADLVVVVDLDAYRRGATEGEERCHVPGVGSVPVSVARRIADDAFIKSVVIDGTDITKVKHFGRYIKSEVRTALDLGSPPDLDGRSCVDCGTPLGLEGDHDKPYCQEHVTEKANMKDRCRPDHKEKTRREREEGLYGGLGGGNDPP